MLKCYWLEDQKEKGLLLKYETDRAVCSYSDDIFILFIAIVNGDGAMISSIAAFDTF